MNLFPGDPVWQYIPYVHSINVKKQHGTQRWMDTQKSDRNSTLLARHGQQNSYAIVKISVKPLQSTTMSALNLIIFLWHTENYLWNLLGENLIQVLRRIKCAFLYWPFTKFCTCDVYAKFMSQTLTYLKGMDKVMRSQKVQVPLLQSTKTWPQDLQTCYIALTNFQIRKYSATCENFTYTNFFGPFFNVIRHNMSNNHLDATAARMLEKNVLWLQIAVNNVQSKQGVKALQNGVCHLADNWRTEATEMAALEQVVQVDTEQFKSDAHVGTEIEVFQHVNHIELVFPILPSHKCHTNNLHKNSFLPHCLLILYNHHGFCFVVMFYICAVIACTNFLTHCSRLMSYNKNLLLTYFTTIS